jgi:hypothetical protein
MAMDVEKVYPWNYEMDDSATEDLVVQRFTDAKTYSADAYETMKELIDSLGSVFTGASMPETNIEYLQQEFSTSSELDGKRPEPPTDEQLTMGEITEPVAPVVTEITPPTLITPTFDSINLPDIIYSFAEIPYASELATRVRAALISWIQTGGTGLSTEVEAALWERARARQQSQNEKLYADEENYFAARGWLMPPGAMAAGLREINREIERANSQLNYEISIEQARLAQANTQFVFTTGLQLEAQDKELANQVANRALQAAKDAVQVIVDIFDAKVKERLGQYELVKVEADTARAIVEMQASANRSKSEIYAAEIERYKVDVQKELGIIESIAKVYGFKVAGFEADAKVEAARVDAQIKEYLGRIEQEKAKTELSLKEAEMTLQSFLAALNLNVETIKGSANIASQVAASALSGISAHTSLSDGMSRSIGKSYSHDMKLDNSYTVNATSGE